MNQTPQALKESGAEGTSTPATRTEVDSVGSMQIPADAYWGIHTARAIENFPITKRPISVYPDLVTALARVKQAAARANKEIGVLDAEKADLIDRVCEEIVGGGTARPVRRRRDPGRRGHLDEHEHERGHRQPVPRAHGPQARRLRVPAPDRRGQPQPVHERRVPDRDQARHGVRPASGCSTSTSLLTESFAAKGVEFANVLKVGRTQLQDAVPMTLGQEFSGFAHTLIEDHDRLSETIPWLNEINMGATAIGTGITADPRYAEAVCRHLVEVTGLDMVTSPDLIEATSDAGIFMTVSGTLKRAAVKLSKICNDLRLLSSGPQAGIGEINLPVRQAGLLDHARARSTRSSPRSSTRSPSA